MKNYREDIPIKEEEKDKKEEKEIKLDNEKGEEEKLIEENAGKEIMKKNVVEEKKDDKREKIRKIIDKIEKDNEKLINRVGEQLNGIIEENKDFTSYENNENIKDNAKMENNIEINFEQFSIIAKTKNFIIKFFNLIMPFKNDINYIKKKYNKTVLMTFKIYRFLFLMSLFAFIIYFILCFFHVIKQRDSLSDLCKYGIPCFLLYTSFTEEEGFLISLIYCIWLLFFFTSSITFYFILNSEENEKDIYFKINNNHLSFSYLISSWNFNFKTESASQKKKKIIKEELSINSKNQIKAIKGGSEWNCTLLPFILVNIIFIAYLFIEFIVIILCFFVRQLLRENNKVLKKLKFLDIIADIVTYVSVGVALNLFVWLSSIFPVFEAWKREKYKKLSETIKKLISFLVGLISLIFILSYVTLNVNDDSKLLPFFDENHYTLFGCPGNFKIVTNPYTLNRILGNFDKIERINYSQCREEDIGITLFFIFIIYIIFLFFGELFNLVDCGCKNKPAFRPNFSVIRVYSVIIFYQIVIYYIPFLALLFPLLMLIIYKFQYSILNNNGSISFNENIVNKRNTNNNFILNSFLIFTILVFCITGYFYFESFPEFYTADCYTPKRINRYNYNILVYDYNKFCGPTKYQRRLSSILTNKMKDTFAIGWISDLLSQIPFIIELLCVIFVIIIYRNYNPDKRYYNYIMKRQQEIMETFHFLSENFKKGDIISSMLLKIAKEKIK